MSDEVKSTWTADEQKAHRKLWVEALRSGNYQQAADELRSDHGFCCLGVACDLSKLGEWRGSRYQTPDYEHNGELEDDVKRWLGLRTRVGFFEPFEEFDNLAEMNDGGKSFAEIADVIEAEPEGLLTASSAS